MAFGLVGFADEHMTTVLCADFYFTDASSHVRTEPFERHRPNWREKKREFQVAGRSHGLGCTAASNTGDPVLLSVGQPGAPVRFDFYLEDVQCTRWVGEWIVAWTMPLTHIFAMLQRTASIYQPHARACLC